VPVLLDVKVKKGLSDLVHGPFYLRVCLFSVRNDAVSIESTASFAMVSIRVAFLVRVLCRASNTFSIRNLFHVVLPMTSIKMMSTMAVL
jgi:hypothetical protein